MSDLMFCNCCKSLKATIVSGTRVLCTGCGYTLCLSTQPRFTKRPPNQDRSKPIKTKAHQQAYASQLTGIPAGKEAGLQHPTIIDGTTQQDAELGTSVPVHKRVSKTSKRKQRNHKQTTASTRRKTSRTGSKRRKKKILCRDKPTKSTRSVKRVPSTHRRTKGRSV